MNSLERLTAVQKRLSIILPEVYEKFFLHCMSNRPADLIGTDLINDDEYLTEAAKQLLAECGVDNFLREKDFVFMMHQGYMFWFFEASGDPNPQVFGFNESKKTKDAFGLFSQFIKEYQ